MKAKTVFLTWAVIASFLVAWQGFRICAPETQAPGEIVPAPARLVTGKSHDTHAHDEVTPVAQVPAFELRSLASVFPDLETAPASWRDYNPQRITIAPLHGQPLDFEATHVARDDKFGLTVWTGRNADLPGASLAGVGSDRGWTGVLMLADGDQYTFSANEDGVVQVRRSQEIPPNASRNCVSYSETSKAAATPAAEAVALADEALQPPLDEADENGFFYSDLLYVVDEDFVGSLQTGSLDADQLHDAAVRACAAFTASMNTILENSLVNNLRWRMRGVFTLQPGFYTFTTLRNALGDMMRLETSLGQEVQASTSACVADQVLFISGQSHVSGDPGGIASQSGDDNQFATFAAAYNSQGIYCFAHELGHNIGLRHDREQQESDGLKPNGFLDNNGKYYYGFRAGIQAYSAYTGTTIIKVGDVMSYQLKMPYFSNPDIFINNDDFSMAYGVYTFASGTTQFGVPIDQPKAANAARWLREKAQLIASFRSPLQILGSS